MRSLFISQQGYYVSLQKEKILIRRGEQLLDEVQIPLLEQILIFGKSQVTTQVIRECLKRDIPIAYLSRMGFCYGRLIPIERGYRQLARYQQQLSMVERLLMARLFVWAKIKNSRVILQRQARKGGLDSVNLAVQNLEHLANSALVADEVAKLMGVEGAAAAIYFSAFGDCLANNDFVFVARSRRPPGNPVNAMLSFGYQVLWNHLLALIELQGLDPYYACLHQGTERHAALASDLIEEFRASIVDSLVLYLVNRSIVSAVDDFQFRDGGCFLNDTGRKKFLRAFIQRMEEVVQADDGENLPRWNVLGRQVKLFKSWVYDPSVTYKPHLIR